MFVLNYVASIFLLTRVCLTSGILSSNTSPDSSASARVPPAGYRYAAVRLGHPFREHPADKAARGEESQDNGFASVVSPGGFAIPKGQQQQGPPSHLHSNTKSAARVTVSAADKDKSRDLPALISRQSHSEENTGRRVEEADRCVASSYPADCHGASNLPPSGEEAAFDALKTSTAKPCTDEHHPHARRRSSYRITEDFDDSPRPRDDSTHEEFPGYYPDASYSSTGPKDLATAVKILDHLLSRTLNDEAYNSELHPPTNPILALVLSRYGHYLSRTKSPRLYANMAVNNIHNHKPFGNYKLERDDDPPISIKR